MKKYLWLFIVPFLLIAFPVFAADVSFEWDANTESDLAGYRLYQSDTSGLYTYGTGNEVKDIPAGTETCTVTGVPDGVWYWVLTAYDTHGNESGPSNEVSADIDETPPGPPVQFRCIID